MPRRTTNMGWPDRLARITVGLVLVAGFFHLPDPPWRLALLVGLLPLASGLAGICPIYRALGCSSLDEARDDRTGQSAPRHRGAPALHSHSNV